MSPVCVCVCVRARVCVCVCVCVCVTVSCSLYLAIVDTAFTTTYGRNNHCHTPPGSLDDDIYLMVIDYVIMLLFASYVMSTDSWLTSKSSLASAAVGFVLLAMVSAFGLGSAFGIQCVAPHTCHTD
jgi:hypothetical protein